MLSVQEAGGSGGCAARRLVPVAATADVAGCEVAFNAGFFVPKGADLGMCLGNVVSDGRVVQRAAHQNVNFGIRADGSLFVGYLPLPPPPPTEAPVSTTTVTTTTTMPEGSQVTNETRADVMNSMDQTRRASRKDNNSVNIGNTSTTTPTTTTTTHTTTPVDHTPIHGGSSTSEFVQLISGVLWLIKVPGQTNAC